MVSRVCGLGVQGLGPTGFIGFIGFRVSMVRSLGVQGLGPVKTLTGVQPHSRTGGTFWEYDLSTYQGPFNHLTPPQTNKKHIYVYIYIYI